MQISTIKSVLSFFCNCGIVSPLNHKNGNENGRNQRGSAKNTL